MQPTGATPQAVQDFPSLSFQVDKNRCSITARCVVAIMIMPEDITNLPDAPGYCKGLITVRGQVLPLVDMRTLLGAMSFGGFDDGFGQSNDMVVVIEGPQGSLGLVVDKVYAVETIQPVDSDQSSAFFAGSRYIQGIGRSERSAENLLIMDEQALLSLSDGLQF